ncbi:DNA-binding LacI/PurR family transcriptional regulator [Pseudoduganella flava]|uniref:DNA-binding LacI/PurR family transcriptional regulator n=1 Tax=Pseudoduganella flava TaxID=871742 RepID=A0A562PQ44_9BURK|nr:LacI family DNA-binding transcriptional regulator [Pseudoduganella flava]QGZ37700.1 LacI family DNA-binding transcriptional regulator [Pseudoduganella flava]TWI46498.1 DNA-binding LacI/PurR family transcriptional regulator [Pseudoduganella flava]
MRKTKTPPPVDNGADSKAAEYKAALLRENRRVTSYDVAMVAGVSQSAVSRCFKPGASVSKSTYARVMKAAAGLDYIPNAAARSLITRRSNIVAVVISHTANLYYPEALAELSAQLTRRGKRVLLFTMQHEADVEQILGDVWQYQVDGAIVAAALSEEQVQEFERRRLPLVVFNRNLRGRTVNSVLCDQYESGRLLATRLTAAGHRQFGIVAGPDTSTVATERRNGACDKLHELGLPAPVVVTGQFDYASGARGLREILDRLGRIPDAVICGNDVMALGCLDYARHELSIDVPGTMSVAGFDAVEPSNWLSYNLTTLRQPIHNMALAAADLLTSLIETDGRLAEKRTFAPQFVEGATARLRPLGDDSLAA